MDGILTGNVVDLDTLPMTTEERQAREIEELRDKINDMALMLADARDAERAYQRELEELSERNGVLLAAVEGYEVHVRRLKFQLNTYRHDCLEAEHKLKIDGVERERRKRESLLTRVGRAIRRDI